MFDLTGRNALITGASGDIGGAIAHALHRQGASICISGRRREALETLAGSLSGEGADRVHVEVSALDDAQAVKDLASRAEKALGSVDILVNNAGLTRDSLALRMKDEDWEEVLRVNLTAPFLLSRAFLRSMLKRRWGRIIGISSVSGVAGNPGQANYAAAKAGMIGMTKALAREVAPRGITVNCIAPGFIETSMTGALSPDQQSRIKEQIPAGRFGATEDVAASLVWLASDEAGYVTGQTLHVNGGMIMP